MRKKFIPQFNVDKEKMFNRMKIFQNTSTYNNINDIFDFCIEIAKDKIDFQVVFSVEKNKYFFEIEEIKNCSYIIFCYATLGKNIDVEISDLFNSKNYLAGYLLNEIADEVIMDVTSQLYKYLKIELKNNHCNLTKRYSPGESPLDLSYQKLIFSELSKNFSLSGTLLESCMINPEKSTLFLYGTDMHIIDSNIDIDCNNCQTKNCNYLC